MLPGEAVLGKKTAYVKVGRGEEGGVLVVLACPDHMWGQLPFLSMVLGTVEALARGWDTHDPHCL